MTDTFDSSKFLDQLLTSIGTTNDRAGFNCPVCSSSEWTIVDGTTTQDVSHGVGSIETVPVVCDNCGFIAQFAIKQDPS